MRMLTTQSKMPAKMLVVAALAMAGAAGGNFVVQADTPRVIPASMPGQLIVSPVARQIRPMIASRVASAKPQRAHNQAVPTDVAAVAGPVAVAVGPAKAVVAAKPAVPAQTIAVYTCRVGQDYSLQLRRCVPEAAQPRGVVAAAKSTAGSALPSSGVTVVLPPTAAVGQAMAKQAEPGILSAMQAAQGKTIVQTGAKVAKVKRVLAPDSRMSLGLAPQKK